MRIKITAWTLCILLLGISSGKCVAVAKAPLTIKVLGTGGLLPNPSEWLTRRHSAYLIKIQRE